MDTTSENHEEILPGEGLDHSRMPGHWLLAQMGKRVLRPGGLELTQKMLAHLDIETSDDVVEFAPGLGLTARAALERSPASYIGVERDENAARQVRRFLNGPDRQCLVGRAEATGLPDGTRVGGVRRGDAVDADSRTQRGNRGGGRASAQTRWALRYPRVVPGTRRLGGRQEIGDQPGVVTKHPCRCTTPYAWRMVGLA